MRVLTFLWLSAFVFCTSNGGIIFDLWKEGASKMPILELEYGLDGEELFNALVNNVGGYIKSLDDSISKMISDAEGHYHFQTQSTSKYFLEAVTSLNSSSPPDALDDQLLIVSEVLVDFIENYNVFYNKLRRVPKVLWEPKVPKRPAVMLRPPSRQFGDFINHLDTMLDYDLDRVNEYTMEMLSMAKQRVFEAFEGILANYEPAMMKPLDEMKAFLRTLDAFQTEMEQHSSKGLLRIFNQYKGGVLNYP